VPRSEPGAPWPDPLRSGVEGRVGVPFAEQPLGGLSGRRVSLLDGPAGKAVLKAAPHPREVAFYRDVAPALDPGIAVPQAFWIGTDWLLLEHLPDPLPRERWLADTAVMRSLVALHGSGSARDLVRDPFRPAWDESVDDAALRRLPVDLRTRSARDLARVRAESARWLEGDTLVSGDPNPRNWGTRADDGRVVLFDWERTGFATPAVDVAITVPGLPNRDQLELAATSYLEAANRRTGSTHTVSDLTRGLAVVKTWTAVELLADGRDDPALDDVQQHLVGALPAWLAALP